MTETKDALPATIEAESPQNLQPTNLVRVPPLYCREVFPANVVLSADDIYEFCKLIAEANERAKIIECNTLDMTEFESPEQARERVNECIELEYSYVDNNGNRMNGMGVPKNIVSSFPEELKSFFISNVTYAKRAIDYQPRNNVEVFFDFEKPSLKMDFQNLPSNPTGNRSMININGREEDWVISTTDRINKFLTKRKTTRQMIHASGTYDYLIYLVLLPSLLWIFYKKGSQATAWLETQSIFLNVLLGIYALLLSLLIFGFVFQYFRWLFPPIEYYKKKRLGAYVQRSVFVTLVSGLVLSACYDIFKWLLF